MVDIPGDSSTTSSVSVGGTVNGSIETAGDHDWFRISLSAGQSIQVALKGAGASVLEDPYLRIRDSSGNVIYENDDGGDGLDSLLAFQATYSGIYYIDVAAWDNEAGQYRYTGDYDLQVTAYTPPPLGTITQIANQLTHGYWNGESHHFPVTQGGSISVNLTGLTIDGQNLARQALNQWSDIIGISFVEVASGGKIVFDDNEDGAFSSSSWSQGVITSARVNVSTKWLSDYGTTINTYAFQTYIHEIGHALGLGHAGNYNQEARFPFDARYLNDAWSTSVMSYFSPTENSYFAGLGFSQGFLGTPMLADIVAMSNLYGLSTSTRVGDTIYGFNSTAGNTVYDARLYTTIAYTVFDSGGTDTLDYSGYAVNQLIDLRSGNFSNVGGRTGNVSIAIGVVIENAIGGSLDDEIHGNDADNLIIGNAGSDGLYGWAGNDIFIGGAGNDRISGGVGIDTASYASAAAAINVQGQTVTSVGNAAGIGTDDLFDIETIIGSAYNDSFIGTGFAQRFEGGAGNDTMSGQGGSDTFVGGAGADTFRDTMAWLNGDTIVDFSMEDQIIFSNASLSSFTFSLTGTTLNYSGGQLTFGSVLSSGLIAKAATGGGVALVQARQQFGGPALTIAAFGSGASAGGWSSDNIYPRELADVNGDGRADIVGFGNDGVYVSLGSSGGSFAAPTLATTGFGAGTDAGGWSSEDKYPRELADVNGDGRADIVGFGNNGVYVALATASGTFAAPTLATTEFGAGTGAGAGGWASDDKYPRKLADVNGDGRADIVGFGNDGVYVALATASGAFAAPTLATTAFGAGAGAGGWFSEDRYQRDLADVNGDGRADIVGFGNDGVYVALANADGTFAAPKLGLREFGAGAGGWTSDNRYPRMLGDVNDDGKVDIVGFGNDGVFIALGKGNGTFESSRLDLKFFGASSQAGGWSSADAFPRRLADVNDDGAADIVGFASTGVYVALSFGDIWM